MDQPHYDVDSLAYMSTDIVLADVAARPDHKYIATVTGILYGSLQVGEKLDKLSDFFHSFAQWKTGRGLFYFWTGGRGPLISTRPRHRGLLSPFLRRAFI